MSTNIQVKEIIRNLLLYNHNTYINGDNCLQNFREFCILEIFDIYPT